MNDSPSSTAGPLLVVELSPADSAAAPEFRYLRSWVDAQAASVFGGCERIEVPPEGDAALPPGFERRFGWALLVGAGEVLLTGRGLAALRGRLEAGGDSAPAPTAAAPLRLAEAGELSRQPVYTLAGFERLEQRFAELATPPPASGSAPAAVLVRSADLARHLGDRSPAQLLADLARLAPTAADAPPAALCHEFIDYYGEVRADSVPHLPPGTASVLEIGCGRGATGAHLQAELGCRVTGVDLNPVAAGQAAERLHLAFAGDVEDPAVLARLAAAEPGGYDAVLACELFEHLIEPERFLERIRRLVAPGGRIVLSVPNVGHYSVVEDLLAGRWDYLPIGILCYTHYRFFTRRTLEDWLARCGFSRFELVAQTTEPPPWLDASGSDERPRLGLLEADPESLQTKGFWVRIDL